MFFSAIIHFMNWAFKRQVSDLFILIIIFGAFGFLIAYPFLNEEPTCMDGKQNGREIGVDCGGTCVRACIAEVDPVSVLWSRAFRVVHGRYNAVAYLENHNQSTAVNKINYQFRFADANNIYIGKRDGSAFIPPGGNFVIFEPGIDIGNSIPVYTTFEFTQTPQWLQVSQEKIDQLKILVSNIQLVNETIFPKLSATIKNNSLFTIPNMDVIAILYDMSGNAISASRTFLDQINPLQSTDINFTWPEPLSGKVVVKEIIPMYNIFSAQLK